jgi:hypothetical protein
MIGHKENARKYKNTKNILEWEREKKSKKGRPEKRGMNDITWSMTNHELTEESIRHGGYGDNLSLG